MRHFRLVMEAWFVVSVGGAVSLLLIWLISSFIRRRYEAWLEKRAIAMRNVEQAKTKAQRDADMRKWGLYRHVAGRRIDPARSTGQFHVPRSMSDMKKGVHF